jgi:hypothetical protein
MIAARTDVEVAFAESGETPNAGARSEPPLEHESRRTVARPTDENYERKRCVYVSFVPAAFRVSDTSSDRARSV